VIQHYRRDELIVDRLSSSIFYFMNKEWLWFDEYVKLVLQRAESCARQIRVLRATWKRFFHSLRLKYGRGQHEKNASFYNQRKRWRHCRKIYAVSYCFNSSYRMLIRQAEVFPAQQALSVLYSIFNTCAKFLFSPIPVSLAHSDTSFADHLTNNLPVEGPSTTVWGVAALCGSGFTTVKTRSRW